MNVYLEKILIEIYTRNGISCRNRLKNGGSIKPLSYPTSDDTDADDHRLQSIMLREKWHTQCPDSRLTAWRGCEC